MDSVEELRKKLNHPDEAERIYTVHDIMDNNITELLPDLVEKLVTDESIAVKDAIVEALKNMNISSIYERLFELFSSPDAYLRNAAVEIFASSSDKEGAVAFLASKLDHSNKEVRKLILDSLVGLGTPSALMAIRASLYDSSKNVQITAVEYLGKLRDKESLPELIELFKKDPEPMLRVSILHALREIKEGFKVKDIIKMVLPEKKVTEENIIFLPELMKLVADLGEKDDIIYLLEIVKYDPAYAYDLIDFLIKICQRFPELKKLEQIHNIYQYIKDDPTIEEGLKTYLGEGCFNGGN
ncbi:MAG: HEAT repeat [Thermodesulfobacterium sp.]|uniref:HEAT repeat n=1 Tax=Candidatus Thermodesulfobacterium syntrophicum TaxID=3060442 RepID=A0AAE3P538_9BACT|nr:HEAT repeat [Candidatus Thermodesulfobacterium syntrophicum]